MRISEANLIFWGLVAVVAIATVAAAPILLNGSVSNWWALVPAGMIAGVAAFFARIL